LKKSIRRKSNKEKRIRGEKGDFKVKREKK
jgi:hypothetical protein